VLPGAIAAPPDDDDDDDDEPSLASASCGKSEAARLLMVVNKVEMSKVLRGNSNKKERPTREASTLAEA